MNDLSLHHQISPSLNRAEIETLLSLLQSTNGTERQHARETLGKVGRYAVPLLIQLLARKDDHTRWEVCKILGHIGDPSTGIALAEMLSDDNMDVRWVAAEALVSLGHNAMEPLLHILQKDFDSVFVRESAHHVLHSLKREFYFHEKIEMVYDALTDNVPTPRLAIAATAALRAIRTRDAVAMKRKELFH